MSKFSRRSFLATSSAFAGMPAGRTAALAADPIRIGCVTALSGPQDVIGRPILTGAMIAADQINQAGGLLGRPIQIVPANAHADPAAAAAEAARLMAAGVNLLCGCVTSDVALAVTPLLRPHDAILIGCSAQSDKLTHEAFTPNFFRITDQTYMRQRAQARLMAERYPAVTDWVAIIPESEYGRSAYAAFRDGLMTYYPDLAGREVSLPAPITAPFGATDFRQQLEAVKASGAEGLFVAVYGGDAIGLYRQARKAGVLKQIKVLADSYNEFLVPLQLGSSTPEHLWLAVTWYYGGYQQLPMARRLFDDNLRRTGDPMPLGFLNSGHAAIYAYHAAVGNAGRTETAAVIAALEGSSFDTAKGRVTLRREDHQAICDVNFVRIRASDADVPLDMLDYVRPDVEVAEFIRYDGASVIEPPTPGQPLTYRAGLASAQVVGARGR